MILCCGIFFPRIVTLKMKLWGKENISLEHAVFIMSYYKSLPIYLIDK